MQENNDVKVKDLKSLDHCFSISVVGNKSLRATCLEVIAPNDDLPRVIADLNAACAALGGEGMAANQLGYPWRVCVVRSNSGNMTTMVNPQVVESSDEKDSFREGCFSIPGFTTLMIRHSSIRVRYTDERGMEQDGWAEGREARAIQHEIDHLNGVLISDMAQFGQNKVLSIVRAYRKRGSVIKISELGELVA